MSKIANCVMPVLLLSGSLLLAAAPKPAPSAISFRLDRNYSHAFETKTGGEIVQEVATATIAGEEFQTASPGRRLVNPIALKRTMGTKQLQVTIQGITGLAINKVSALTVQTNPQSATTGTDGEWARHIPGNITFKDITLTSSDPPSAAVQTWYDAVQQGQNVRKDIQISLSSSSTPESRAFRCVACLPVSYSSTSTVDKGGKTLTESVLRVRPSRVDMSGSGGQAPVGLVAWYNLQVRKRPTPATVTVDGQSFATPFVLAYTFSGLDANSTELPQDEFTFFLNGPVQ